METLKTSAPDSSLANCLDSLPGTVRIGYEDYILPADDVVRVPVTTFTKMVAELSENIYRYSKLLDEVHDLRKQLDRYQALAHKEEDNF